MSPTFNSQARFVIGVLLCGVLGWPVFVYPQAAAEDAAADKLVPPKRLVEAGVFKPHQGELAERTSLRWASVLALFEPEPWPEEAEDSPPPAALPHKAAELIRQSEVASQTGQPYRAVQLLREAEMLSSGHLAVTRALGLAYAESGNLTRSARYLRKVIANQPDDLEAVLLLARHAAQAGHIQRTLTYCKALEQAQAHVLADYYRALALARQNYTTAASERLASALDASKGIDLDALNRKADTPAFFLRELAVLEQTSPQLRIQQGDWLLQSGAYEQADQAYASVELKGQADRFALTARRAYLALLAQDRAAAIDHVLPLMAHPEAAVSDTDLIVYLLEQGVSADRLAKRLEALMDTQGVTLPRLAALSKVSDQPDLLKPISTWLSFAPATPERLAQAAALFSFDDRQPGDAKALSELLRLMTSHMAQSPEDASDVAHAAINELNAPVTLLRAIQSGAVTHPPTVYADLIVAIGYASAGRLHDAQKRYAAIYASGQGLEEQVRLPLVRTHLALGQGERALSLLGEINPDMPRAEFALAIRAMAAADQVQQALALVEQRAKVHGKQLKLDVLRIELIAQLGRPLQACNLLLRLISSHPDDESLYRLGIDLAYEYRMSFDRLTDADRMRQAFLARLISNLPDSLLAQVSRAQGIKSNPAKVSEAEAILLNLLEAYPGHLSVLPLLVELYDETGDKASAEAMFSRYAQALGPGVNRGLIVAERAIERKHKRQALQALDEVLALDEEGVLPGPAMSADQALALLQSLESVDGERDTDALYLAMIRRFPDHAGLNNALGYRWVVEDKNLLQAKAMIERALKSNPTSYSILDSLAWAQYKLGRFDQAHATQSRSLVLLEQWLARFRRPGFDLPADIASDFGATTAILNDHMGDILYRRGDGRKAIAHWRTAQEQAYTEEQMQIDPELRTLGVRLKAKIDAMAADQPVPVAEVPGPASHGPEGHPAEMRPAEAAPEG